jgi:hypothetical protein
MTLGRTIKALYVMAEEKEKLLARRPRSSQALAVGARLVLGCDEGMSNIAVGYQVEHHSARLASGANGWNRCPPTAHIGVRG